MDDLAERILTREVEIRNRMRTQAVAAMHARQRLLEIQAAHQQRQSRSVRRSLGQSLETTPMQNPLDDATNNDAADEYRLVLRTKHYHPATTTALVVEGNAAENDSNREIATHFGPLAVVSEDRNGADDLSLFGMNSQEVVCTICLGAIQDNDRVGDINCGHIFHVACLKQWLQRKNACPLCQCPGLAYPKRRRRLPSSDSNNFDQA
eukprot:CAMPEP_0196827542 /NCGR_PEP_ID=MMETSP1362-20130617/94209_1 /TAXON_ID=163516 /ORGANISM="Leptocylindrus danicus, Strain CCMP1856" /LENGTH=206 /DNA_ID=CAMNT_0042208183 /DNA_START=641 /DNA_END=1261 /DNA_ORIENTATION=-